MREALARSDLDFTLSERPRRASPPRRKVTTKSEASIVRRVLGDRPWRSVAIALFATMMAGVLVNALLMQRGPHPAPLFPPASLPAAAKPQPRLVAVEPKMPESKAAEPIASPPVPRVEPAPVEARSAARPAPAAAVKDPLGQLIENGDAERKSVLAAQRALAKLGYDVKPDGVYGATTRHAIMKFEHDHKRPGTGELTPSVKRDLAAKATPAR